MKTKLIVDGRKDELWGLQIGYYMSWFVDTKSRITKELKIGETCQVILPNNEKAQKILDDLIGLIDPTLSIFKREIQDNKIYLTKSIE